MWRKHLPLLVCPECLDEVELDSTDNDPVLDGALRCADCAADYRIVNGMPRFVPLSNYADSFGLEWNVHATTQYDSASRSTSEARFHAETGWSDDLHGSVILEAGSGSGRFTPHALGSGATVVSFDYSEAVAANHASNGDAPNLLLVQADIVRMPFRPASFDYVYCFGVVQHTPNPHATVTALAAAVKPGGRLPLDVYRKSFAACLLHTKYYVRLWSARQEPAQLYRWSHDWVDRWWPLTRIIARVPRLGRSLNWRLLVADYRHLGLSDREAREWAYLDTFDMLSPRYDLPQTLTTVRRWLQQAGLVDVDAGYGYNGIEARARHPG